MMYSLRVFNWVCIVFVLLGAAGHTAGSLANYPTGSEILVYALGMSVLALVCGTANIVRTRRPSDRSVALIACLSAAGQAGVALGWGFAIGNPLDPRVVGFVVAAGSLAALSAWQLLRPGRAAGPGAIARRMTGL